MKPEQLQKLKERNLRIARLLRRVYVKPIDIDNYNPSEDYIEREETYIRKILEVYSTNASIVFSEIETDKKFPIKQKKLLSKSMFVPHLKHFLKVWKKMINNKKFLQSRQYPTYDESILNLFSNIDFGSFIDKEYIISRIIEENKDFDFLSEYPKIISTLPKQNLKENIERENLLDFSDNKATEKIIFLKKLGVLDFLRDKDLFRASTNKLAEYLSAVTGEKSTTLQSYLNPIVSANISQKNNPLSNSKNVKKVEQILINSGFSNKDFTS